MTLFTRARQSVHQFGPNENCAFCSWSTVPASEFVASGAWEAGICSGPNSDDAYAACARAEAPLLEGGCAGCSIVCANRVDADAWIADAGDTMLFDDIELDQSAWRGLPVLIPQSDGSPAGVFHAAARPPAWAVGMRRVFSPDSWTLMPKWQGDGIVNTAMGLPDETPTVFVGYGTDPVVENWWSRHRRDKLVEHLSKVGFELVLAPNYSLYGNWPRSFHLLNFRRNLLVAQEFSNAGQLVAPNLYWFRLEDLQRYLRWAEDTRPRVLAVNLQTFRLRADWEEFLLPGLTWLAAMMPSDIHWVFVTGGNVARLRTVVDLFGSDRVTFVTQKPWQTAAHGQVLNDAGKWVSSYAKPVDNFTESFTKLNGWLTGDKPWPDVLTAEAAAAGDD